MIKYLGYWNASETEEKKKAVEEAWALSKTTLDDLSSSGSPTEFCFSYDCLSMSAIPLINYMGNHGTRAAVIRDVMAFGEKALDDISDVADPLVRARVLARASTFMDWYSCEFVDVVEGQRTDRVARDLWEKARSISEGTAYSEIAFFADWPLQPDPLGVDHILVKALEFGSKVGDRLVIGSVLDWMAQRDFFRVPEAVDSEEQENLATRSLEFSHRAQREYAVVGYLSPNITWLWSADPEPWYYSHLSYFTADLKKKRALGQKALEYLPSLKDGVGRSGYRRYMLAWSRQPFLGKEYLTREASQKKLSA